MPSLKKVLIAFACYGPIPAALFFLVIALWERGIYGVAPWSVFLFFTYLCGVVPAMLAGLVWFWVGGKFGFTELVQSSIASCGSGAAVGFIVGCVSGIAVFGTSPDLVTPQPLLDRLISNLLVLAVPGLFGGALAGLRIFCMTRSKTN
jgi:hypothetical protein